MKIADTNVLINFALRDILELSAAEELVEKTLLQCNPSELLIPVQVLGEFCSVMQKVMPRKLRNLGVASTSSILHELTRKAMLVFPVMGTVYHPTKEDWAWAYDYFYTLKEDDALKKGIDMFDLLLVGSAITNNADLLTGDRNLRGFYSKLVSG